MDKYEAFINEIAEPAQRICKEYGLPASVCIAQAILESSWGDSVIGNANYFGRKWGGWGNYVKVETQEDDGTGNLYTITAKFQDYDSVDQAIKDWCELITQEPCYAEVNNHLGNLEDFVTTLAGIYATDIYYAQKIMQTIRANNLTQYDEISMS